MVLISCVQQTVSALAEQAVLTLVCGEQTEHSVHTPFFKYCWDLHAVGGLGAGGLGAGGLGAGGW